MKLLKQSDPMCLLYSFAMVLDEDPEILIEEIGEDGLDIWFSEQHHPKNLRGHHIQEMVDVCYARGFALTPISVNPSIAPSPIIEYRPIWAQEYCEDRFLSYLKDRRAVIITRKHAVAWDGVEVFDPMGYKRTLDDYVIREAWILNQFLI